MPLRDVIAIVGVALHGRNVRVKAWESKLCERSLTPMIKLTTPVRVTSGLNHIRFVIRVVFGTRFVAGIIVATMFVSVWLG
jgi:hypothetical protein